MDSVEGIIIILMLEFGCVTLLNCKSIPVSVCMYIHICTSVCMLGACMVCVSVHPCRIHTVLK